MNQLKDYIKHERAVPLSMDRLKSFVFKPNLKFMEYSKLIKARSLNAILGHNGGVVILWDSEKNPKIGHYTLLFKSRGTVHYFDPLGFEMMKLASITGNNPQGLSRLLKGVHVRTNRVKYQSQREDTQSCGRHCCMRYNLKNFSDEQYRKLMTYSIQGRVMDMDDLMVLMTLPKDLSHWEKTLAKE